MTGQHGVTTDEVREEVLRFDCELQTLWGILSRPAAPRSPSATAVLIMVGGPQYRVGSHRMFVRLARALAATGYAVLRFDYRGMGDSEGELRDFTGAAPDLRAALDALFSANPLARRAVVWGLCDAASAAMMFATRDPRVSGIVAANPWARSEATLAAARVKHYYAARLLQREFWRKLLGGGMHWRDSLRSLIGSLKRSRVALAPSGAAPFQVAMADGLRRFSGRVLLILSGNDLTAREFRDVARSSDAWRDVLHDGNVSRVELPEADHTFSQHQWLDQVADETIAWLNRFTAMPGNPPALQSRTPERPS